MNKLPSFAALVSAALIGSAAGTAWSDQATTQEPAQPAMQTPAPVHGFMPGWYPPYSPGPQHWRARPREYGQMRPYYRPRGHHGGTPAAPATAPTTPPAVTQTLPDPALTEAQEKLHEKSTQLGMAQAALEQLHGKLEYSLETERTLADKLAHLNREIEASQARLAQQGLELETATAKLEQYHRQIDSDQQQNLKLAAEHDRLRDELAGREEQLASTQSVLQAATAGHDRLRDELAGREEQLASMQSVLQAATDALQQAHAETTVSGQQLDAAMTQAEQCRNGLNTLNAQLAARKNSQLNTEQMLATVVAERDRQQADLADCSRKLGRTQAELTGARSELEALRLARSAVIDTVAPAAAGGPVTVEPAAGISARVEPAAGNAPDAAGEVVALKSSPTDTDQDGIADRVDLCPGTQPGLEVDATGCAADVAIKLEGVNFLYNSHELTNEARRILERVAGVISQQPELRLEVAGHTDATGDPSYNQWLSMQRAEAVRDYLVAQGVNPRQIGATGYGGQRPIADNDTLEGLRKNRRVELRRLQ